MAYLTANATSKSRRDHIYARAGAQVTIIAEHGTVLIVEDENGQRFPALRQIVTDNPVSDIKTTESTIPTISVPSPTKTVITTPRKRKSSAQQQQNLF